jgi:hypothetical protein
VSDAHLNEFAAASAASRGSLSVEEFVYAVNISLRFNCLYVETPKAGCSTIKHTLMNAELGIRLHYACFEDIHLRQFSPLLSPQQVGPWSDYLGRKPTVFCFVRNPYERLLSGYLDKIARPGPYREERLRALGLPSAAAVSFVDFVAALERRDAGQFDAHWRPQYLQSCYESLPPDFVGRFETLERDLRTVLTRIGIDFAGAYQPELRHQTQAAALCGRYYTPDLRARVYGLYRRDFELFAYPA